MNLDAVFKPKRVALVGASDQPGKVGSLLWQNLASFEGEVIPVTGSSAEVGGVPAFARLGDIDGTVDLAVVAVPAVGVAEVATDAAAAGVGAMVVLSGGFAEIGPEGVVLQQQLAKSAAGTRIVGPNCFGVQNAAIGLNASIAVGSEVEPGSISLITQSGAYGMAIHAMGRDEQVRFGKVYASGNKVDIDDAEVIDYLAQDEETTTICVFAESVGDGRALARAVASAAARTPVIIAKTGRSDAGSRAAQSHTGSLGTRDVVFRAVMQQAGAVLVRSGLEMLDVARALDSQPLPRGPRAAIITNSGGTGVELVDMLSDEGIDVPELSDGLQRRIAERLPAFASSRNPVDMTPVWSRFAELYPWLIDTLARSGEVDLIVPVLLQRSAIDRVTVSAVGDAVEMLGADRVLVPVYVCWVAPRSARINADELQRRGVPCFEWPDRTARAIGHAAAYAVTRARASDVATIPPPADRVLADGPLGPEEAARLLSVYGITTVETAVCGNSQDAVDVAAAIDGPVVMKAADAKIPHRTEMGGVRLGLVGAGAVRRAYDELFDLGNAVLIQSQLDGVEVAVGALRDPDFGPVVMIGFGGTNLELVGDVAFGLAPLSTVAARSLIAGLKGAALLMGFRGAPVVDMESLVATVVGIGNLIASHPEISEVDLNPVMAREDGAVAVDWKLTVAGRDREREE